MSSDEHSVAMVAMLVAVSASVVAAMLENRRKEPRLKVLFLTTILAWTAILMRGGAW